jgi:hypothetical protein
MVGRLIRFRRLRRDLWGQIDQWAGSDDHDKQDAAVVLLKLLEKHGLLHPKPNIRYSSDMIRDLAPPRKPGPEPLPPTEGQRRLYALLEAGGDAKAIAMACGVEHAVVLAWASRKDRPDPVSCAVLERDFKVPAAWRSE